MNYTMTPDGTVIEEPDIFKWGKWFMTADRTVCKTMVGESEVSTVFLSIDHAFDGGRPVLFETMVFGLPDDEEVMHRYHTWQEAQVGHDRTVKTLRSCNRRRWYKPWTWWCRP